MKKFDLRSLCLSLATLGAVLMSHFAIAQNAKVQWINNSAASMLDTIDIYVDGVLVKSDLLFRQATNLNAMTPGAHTVNINAASSIDSGDQVISRQAVTIQGNSNTVIVITGVDNPAMYDANPSGRATDVKLVVRKGVLFSTSTASASAISFYHGCTDSKGINISTRPSGTFTVNALKYGDTTANFTPASVETYFDVKDSSGTNILKSYLLPLNNYGKNSLSIFASGFLNPATNQNGAAFGLYAADTLGNVIALQEAARMQLVNNAPDVILNSVDVWLNNTKVASNLAFRTATTTFNVLAGNYTITVTKKNSPDTTGTNVVYRIANYTVTATNTYLGILAGVVDTNSYKTNPNGLDRSFKLSFINNYAESNSNATLTTLYFSNGVPDATNLAYDKNPLSPVALFGTTVYNATPTSTTISILPTTQVLLEKISGEISKSYRISLSGKGGKAGVLLASGFMDTVGNKTGASVYQVLIAYTDGTIAKLDVLSGNIQFIHTSADPTVSAVKLFINGKVAKDSLKFRFCTPYIALTPYKAYRIHLTSASATDTTSSIYSFSLLPDSGKYYYAIAAGLVNPSSFAANPEGIDRSFTVILNPGAKIIPSFSNKNVDIMYFHSLSDAPSTTIRGEGQTLYMSKFDAYKSFHPYNVQSGFDDISYNVKNAFNDSVLFNSKGMFEKHRGMVGLVASTGFLNPSNNQNGEKALLFAYWPDGVTDTLPSPYTGLKSPLTFDASNIDVYPNPANNQVHIGIDMKVNQIISIELFDLTGKSIHTENALLSQGRNELTLNISDLMNGFYIVKLTGQGQVFNTKLNVIR